MNVQITEEEKFEMYMKLTKKELARLLVEKDNLINMAMQPSFPVYPTYPTYPYPSEPISPYYGIFSVANHPDQPFTLTKDEVSN